MESREKHAFEEYKKKMVAELEEAKLQIKDSRKLAKKMEAKQIEDPRRHAKEMKAKENERGAEIKKSNARFEKQKKEKL